MAGGGRWWRVDDWMRPGHGAGYAPGRPVTPRDRTLMFATVIGVLLVEGALAAFAGRDWALRLSGGLVGLAVLQVVQLVRTRGVGWG